MSDTTTTEKASDAAESVYSYFICKLGAVPSDETLLKLPCASPCGEDCVKAINAAERLIKWSDIADPAISRDIRKSVEHVVEIFWRG